MSGMMRDEDAKAKETGRKWLDVEETEEGDGPFDHRGIGGFVLDCAGLKYLRRTSSHQIELSYGHAVIELAFRNATDAKMYYDKIKEMMQS